LIIGTIVALLPVKYKGFKMAINMNKHTFKGHKTLLGNKYVTYGEVELPPRYDLFSKSSNGFDWGNNNSGSVQLSFSILYQLSDKETAQQNAVKFTQEIVSQFNSRDWRLSAFDVSEWINNNKTEPVKIEPIKKEPKLVLVTKPKTKKTRVKKENVVKDVCKELNITQKQLAEILEIPEGTVSSWAVKNEIPRLGKKAIEFYKLSTKNQKIVDSYKGFMNLLQAS